MGGAVRLAKEARTEPTRFFRFGPAYANTEGAALAALATRNGAAVASDIAGRAVELLAKIARPTAFYVRLLNPAHGKFAVVESFFREVVNQVVNEKGMKNIKINKDKKEYTINKKKIFKKLNN